MDVSKVRNLSGLDTRLGASPSSTDASAVSTSSETGLSSSVMGPGKWTSQLESLLDTDPDKFSEVTGTIAEELEDDAVNATGEEAQLLSDLAARFAEASESGHLPAFRLPAGKPSPPSGGEPPRPPAGASGQASQIIPQGYSQSASSMESVFVSVEERIG